LFDPVKGIDPINDLLERAGGNDPCEHSVGLEDGRAGAREISVSAWPTKPRNETLVREHDPCVPTLDQRATQIVGVPAGRRVQYDDVHVTVSRSIFSERGIESVK